MATGSPFLPRMHWPSHWISWGHTRPQTAGRAFLDHRLRDGAGEIALGDQFDKSGDIHRYRATVDTARLLALQTAGASSMAISSV